MDVPLYRIQTFLFKGALLWIDGRKRRQCHLSSASAACFLKLSWRASICMRPSRRIFWGGLYLFSNSRSFPSRQGRNSSAPGVIPEATSRLVRDPLVPELLHYLFFCDPGGADPLWTQHSRKRLSEHTRENVLTCSQIFVSNFLTASTFIAGLPISFSTFPFL